MMRGVYSKPSATSMNLRKALAAISLTPVSYILNFMRDVPILALRKNRRGHVEAQLQVDHVTTVLAIILFVVMLNGCAHAAKDVPPSEGSAVPAQLPARAIIYFSGSPAADDKQLAAVISEACRCHPVLFRQYNGNALIYEIGLPQNHSFASFEKALLAGGVPLGIVAVEQDALMQHQQ